MSKSAISLAKARSLVSEYVIEDMLPLSIVESPAFRKLVSGISLAQVSLPDRKSFTAHLDRAFDMMEQRVRNTLDGINFVCTTADVWTAHNKSFFGMTVHWIDPSILQCWKAAICCTGLVGCHTYNVLASKIESIHRSYSLNGKITATVTDNGSNFLRLLRHSLSQI